MDNKKSYPLIVAKAIQEVLRKIRDIKNTSSGVIEVENYDGVIKVIDNQNYGSPVYYFAILNPNIDSNNKPHFNVEVVPGSLSSLLPYKGNLPIEGVFTKLEWWLGVLKEYDNISFSQSDELFRIYEEEFYEAFEIVDEDSDIAPFDLPRQLMIDKFLSDIAITLEEKNEQYNTQEIITEIEQVKAEITTSTKKVLIRKVSSILSKVRMKGLELLKDVIKDYIKDAIKEGFRIALEVGIKHINNPN